MKSSRTSPNLIIAETVDDIIARSDGVSGTYEILKIEMTHEEAGLILQRVDQIAQYYYTGKHPDGRIP